MIRASLTYVLWLYLASIIRKPPFPIIPAQGGLLPHPLPHPQTSMVNPLFANTLLECLGAAHECDECGCGTAWAVAATYTFFVWKSTMVL